MSTTVETPRLAQAPSSVTGSSEILRTGPSSTPGQGGGEFSEEDRNDFLNVYGDPDLVSGSLDDDTINNIDTCSALFSQFAEWSSELGERQDKARRVLLREAERCKIPDPIIHEVRGFFDGENSLTESYHEMRGED
ncbi:hypothetical protein LTR49_028703 [Elasticomyces elasticus]|nr:hypothetical protein LTR49_028703 [Elasticomyces elasticus]